MYLGKEEREIYENDLKALMDYRAQIKAAERSGRIEGKKEGEQQKEILIVKNLLLMGMNTEFISRASGLEAKKIEEIKRKLK